MPQSTFMSACFTLLAGLTPLSTQATIQTDASIASATIASTATVIAASANPSEQADQDVLLFPYFKNSTSGRSGVFMLASLDGKTFFHLNDGNAIFTPPAWPQEDLTRDPSIVLGPDNRFHMVWTTHWWTQTFGYAVSDDLMHWEAKKIPIWQNQLQAKPFNTWAPELHWDQANQHYLIVWSSTLEQNSTGSPELDRGPQQQPLNHRMFYTTTQDFESFTDPQVLYDPGYSVIDGHIVLDNRGTQDTSDDRYVMALKDERRQENWVTKNIPLAFSQQMHGPFSEATEPIAGPHTQNEQLFRGWFEGPALVHFAGKWHLYGDPYRQRHLTYVVHQADQLSEDPNDWTNITDELVFPEPAMEVSHGTPFVVKLSRVADLFKQSGIQINSESQSSQLIDPDPPLYQDPSFNGAADPVVIYDPNESRWLMYYTNRRANMKNPRGTEWIHGTRIGIATSKDGQQWDFLATAEINYGSDAGQDEVVNTHWAPDVFYHDGQFHMFLSFVPGIHHDWGGTRHIVHLTSQDGIHFDDPKPIDLGTPRAIDACVRQMPDGSWKMWFNDETDNKSIKVATSPDLNQWTLAGKVQGLDRCEGPSIFFLNGYYYLLADQWRGMACFRSKDTESWEPSPLPRLLSEPGVGLEEHSVGRHGDVLLVNAPSDQTKQDNTPKAYLFYFTHPDDSGGRDTVDKRRSSIHVSELTFNEDGWPTTDRNQKIQLNLMSK